MAASLRTIDVAIRLVAEARIREAEEEGRFANLPGSGRPIRDVDEPYDPDWWLRQWLRDRDPRRTA